MSNEDDLTPRAREALANARRIATKVNAEQVNTLHLLHGLLSLKTSLAQNSLESLGINVLHLKGSIIEGLATSSVPAIPKSYSDNIKMVMGFAYKEVSRYKSIAVGTEHILLGLVLHSEASSSKLLSGIGVTATNLRAVVDEILKPSGIPHIQPFNGPTREQTVEEKYPTLSTNAINLTKLAAEGKIDPVIGRTSELNRMVNILCRRRKNNPVLLGEAGVGKTALVEALALLITSENAPAKLKNKIIFSVDMTSMVAGTRYRGEFEEKLKQLLDEAVQSDEIILFVDELHTIVGAGSAEGSLDTANILKPHLARGAVSCIGATTVVEYKASIENDAALGRRFQPLDVLEPTLEDTKDILNGIKAPYEQFHKVSYSEEAIQACVTLADTRLRDRFFPDKAIDLLDESGATASLAGRDTVTAEDIENVIITMESAAKIKAPKQVGF